MKPSAVAEAHRQICESGNCSALATNKFEDECAACPNGHWGPYDCGPVLTPEQVQEYERRLRAFNGPKPGIRIRPGDMLALAIQKITGTQATDMCGCAARQQKMNEWGWLGCWRHREIIVKWLVEEAGKRGHTVTADAMGSLFKAMLKEIRQR